MRDKRKPLPVHPDPDREHEKRRDERLTLPGSRNARDQIDAELAACERYWRGGR